MIDHILIDMDGVLCDFLRGALRLHGYEVSQYPAGEWEIWKVLGITEDAFWKRLASTPDFWLNLQPFPWTMSLIAELEKLRHARQIHWTIATSPARDPSCCEQKARWMQKHIRPNFSNYMMGGNKHLMASPRRLLIDDSPKNCAAFAAHGGSAILFPELSNGRMVPDVAAWFSKALAQALRGGGLGQTIEADDCPTEQVVCP